MFRKMVETIIGGAIGLVTLYVVAKVAYDAGHDMAEAEHRYEEMSDSKPEDDVSGGAEVPEPDGAESESSDPINRNSKKINKSGLFLSASKLFLRVCAIVACFRSGKLLIKGINHLFDKIDTKFIH